MRVVPEPIRRALAFGRFLWRRFDDDQCFEAAGALSYTTIFALVPLLTVGLAVFSLFPEFARFSEAVTNFLFQHLVPASGEELENYIRDFVTKASHLTVWGTLALFISGLLMMTSIEHAFNRIWRVTSPRRALARFVVFWTTLTLGPLLVGAGLAVSSAILANPLFSATSQEMQLETRLLAIMPFAVTLSAFTLGYMVVPNCPVRWRHALVGGALGALAFEVAKAGFAEFVTHFASYQQVYGAVAMIPVFLLWIYVSWVVILLGASLTAAIGAFQHEEQKRELPERQRFPALLAVLEQLYAARQSGVGLSVRDLAVKLPEVPDGEIARLLPILEQQNVAQRTDLGTWVLTRDLGTVSLLELFRAGNFLLPSSETPSGLDQAPTQRYDVQAALAAEAVLNRPVADLFSSGTAPAPPG